MENSPKTKLPTFFLGFDPAIKNRFIVTIGWI